MPIYEFKAKNHRHSCPTCRDGFESLLSHTEPPPSKCPDCGARVKKCISAPNVGASASGFDDRAKSSGFHKLKKTGKGEYEKLY